MGGREPGDEPVVEGWSPRKRVRDLGLVPAGEGGEENGERQPTDQSTLGMTSRANHATRSRNSAKLRAPRPTWNAVAPARRQRPASSTTGSGATSAATVSGATSSSGAPVARSPRA